MWGGDFWRTLYHAAFGFPSYPTEEEREDSAAFFRSLRTMLPCAFCRKSYAGLLEKYPVEQQVESSATLSRWVYQIHSSVCQHLEVPMRVSYEELQTFYLAVLNAPAGESPLASAHPLAPRVQQPLASFPSAPAALVFTPTQPTQAPAPPKKRHRRTDRKPRRTHHSRQQEAPPIIMLPPELLAVLPNVHIPKPVAVVRGGGCVGCRN